MKIVKMKLEDLHPLEKNVRKHSDKQLGEFTRSLDQFGQIRPMVIDEKGTILVGNGMYEAMKRMGWISADCHLVEGLTEHQKTKLMLADNRVYELGMTDMDAFEDIIADLEGDFDIPGWDDDLLETLSSSIAEANEMVENYGVYDQAEVQKVNERQREDHTVLEASSASYAPPPAAPAAAPDAGQVSDRPAQETPTAAPEPLFERFIICPHCGEKVVLNSGMIGGA